MGQGFGRHFAHGTAQDVDQSLKLKAVKDKEQAIGCHFELGKVGLHLKDFFYINEGRAFINHLPLVEQKTWVDRH